MDEAEIAGEWPASGLSKVKIDWERHVFDLISTLVLIIIMMELVAGIIIDTFGELRQEAQEKLIDRKSSCFICGNSLDEFEKAILHGDGGDQKLLVVHLPGLGGWHAVLRLISRRGRCEVGVAVYGCSNDLGVIIRVCNRAAEIGGVDSQVSLIGNRVH